VSDNNLRKIDITKNFSKKSGYSLNFSKKLINNLIDIIILNIKESDFILKNVGSFKIIRKKQRTGRNPKTKEEFIISQRNSISFSVSAKITDHLNIYE
tara:strand:+ start:6048 stop:6341 length:294 start_codon:yes stop_codon:yes gene_type:complete